LAPTLTPETAAAELSAAGSSAAALSAAPLVAPLGVAVGASLAPAAKPDRDWRGVKPNSMDQTDDLFQSDP
jgi:hypothetical protein